MAWAARASVEVGKTVRRTRASHVGTHRRLGRMEAAGNETGAENRGRLGLHGWRRSGERQAMGRGGAHAARSCDAPRRLCLLREAKEAANRHAAGPAAAHSSARRPGGVATASQHERRRRQGHAGLGLALNKCMARGCPGRGVHAKMAAAALRPWRPRPLAADWARMGLAGLERARCWAW